MRRHAGEGAGLAIDAPEQRGDAVAVSRGAWAGLFVSVALWEVFLRADSRILAAGTKLWLFPLMLVVFVSVGATLVRALGAVGRVLLGGERARALGVLAFPLVVGAIVGLEYAFLTYNHPVVPWHYAPLVAGAVGGLTWLAVRLLRRRDRSDPRSTPVRTSSAVLVLATTVLGLGLAATLRRPDVGAALIKRNSVFGRLLGHSLAAIPRHPSPGGSVTRPPDLPAAHALGRASVILVTIDALRRDALGTYDGVEGVSPRLDAFARDALVFDDAYTQVPRSAPSLATVLTGTYPSRHHLRENRMVLGWQATTLAETLASAGYGTGAFVTNPNFAPAFHLDQGFATYHYFASSAFASGLLLDASDPEAIEAALAWLQATPNRPVLLWVHLMAPHWPYMPPADLRPELHPGSGPWFNVWNMGSQAWVVPGRTYFHLGVYTSLYAAEVRSADRLVGQLFDGLAALDLLDTAHVLVFADHGEAFGESDDFAHGRSLDPAATRVPLLWRLPGRRRAGERIATTVQLADIVPSLLRLLGIESSGRFDGRDLSAALLGEAERDDGFAFTEARFLHSMGVRGLLYAVRTRARTLWLDAGYGYEGEFDRHLDPDEEHMRSYARRPDDALHDTLLTLAHTAQESLQAPAAVGEIDPTLVEQLRALGYVQQ